ncbi:MAG TPA: Swt1 family HEPN domain-containing protein [Polyangiaceae bacterium]|nr:Swt1 family HEPN domain-containing protein [Polyangiaceae bacterium]
MTTADHTNDEQPVPEKPVFGIPGLPERNLETYARLWQLETWLRELVYVHLRAKAGDAWEGYVQQADRPKTNDKRLTHMPTAEENQLSYAQLSQVRRIITDNWSMFESYLPPQNVWEAKLDEVAQIRHRVAHFRTTHADDLARVVQLLRDIDAGMWRFCTSYNDPNPVLPPDKDPVVAAFQGLECFPWTEVGSDRWARVGHADPEQRVLLQTEVLSMPWASWQLPIAGREGFLYSVLIYARGHHNHDFKRLLENTRRLHNHVVHVCLGGDQKSFRLAIPAVLGTDAVSKIITAFYDAAMNTLRPGLDMLADDRVQQLADTQPEYVLGPSHPMTFLTPEMPCSIFGV